MAPSLPGRGAARTLPGKRGLFAFPFVRRIMILADKTGYDFR